jgi:hypothetical protein
MYLHFYSPISDKWPSCNIKNTEIPMRLFRGEIFLDKFVRFMLCDCKKLWIDCFFKGDPKIFERVEGV